MSTDYAKASKLARKHKSALTRALNTQDPHKIIQACEAFFAEFESEGLPLPDDWHRWNIAQLDALMALRRKEWS